MSQPARGSETPNLAGSVASPTQTGAAASQAAAAASQTVDPTATPSQGIAPDSPSPTPASSPSASPAAPPLPDYSNHGPRDRKLIALTFDADMYPWMYAKRTRVSLVDRRIVELLASTGTPATVFLNGLFVKAYPDVVRELAANPNVELANHSWDHAAWTAGCPNTSPIQHPMTMRSEVTKTADIIRQVTGVTVQYFRFPGFCRTPKQVALVRSLGEASIGSDCYFGDTMLWSTARQVASVQRGCQAGSIVVTHLNGAPYHPNVYEALKRLIPWWKAHGWQVVTVGELLGHPTP